MMDSLLIMVFSGIINCTTCIGIDMTEYRMLYDTLYQVPVVTVYSINESEKLEVVERGNWLESEKHLGINTPDYNEHFYKTGYDRGHLVPLDNMKYSKEAMNRACLDINMTKQNASFNRGVWREIEEDVTEIIDTSDFTIVVTGVVYKRGNELPPIPTHYYKIVYSGEWIYWLCENKAGLSVNGSRCEYDDILELIEK